MGLLKRAATLAMTRTVLLLSVSVTHQAFKYFKEPACTMTVYEGVQLLILLLSSAHTSVINNGNTGTASFACLLTASSSMYPCLGSILAHSVSTLANLTQPAYDRSCLLAA